MRKRHGTTCKFVYKFAKKIFSARTTRPDLHETAERYLAWVRPLLDDAAYANSEAVVRAFVDGDGKQLQADLQAFAEQQAAQGKSWLIDDWLDAYLSVRDPLPLSTSAGFRLNMDLPDSGLRRLAYFIVGMAMQSADYLNDNLAPNVSPRGEALDMQQWLSLRGIGRVPQAGCDTYTLAPLSPQPRCVVVFWQNTAYALSVLDAEHRPYAVADIFAGLQHITTASPTDKPDATAADVTALSCAPAESAAELLAELSQSPQNRESFEQLQHSLFHIHLSPEAFSDAADVLRRVTFLADDSIWAYKPMTFFANLQDDDAYVHLEHSSLDGGTLQAIITRAEANAGKLTDEATNDTTSDNAPTPSALHWQLEPALQEKLTALREHHRTKAVHYRVKMTEVGIDRDAIPPRTSVDCLMQLPLQYGQLTAFGRIRNTYEAVDVSHFQAGRTECVRPVSSESLTFTQALHTNTATLDDFNTAHQEHKNRIKACKRGHGVNRHLLGLQLMAEKRGINPELFDDSAYTALTQDFLSSTSLGDRKHVGEFAFTPTLSGGLGVSYFINDDGNGFLYCLSYHDDQAAEAEQFIDGLQTGTQRLMQVLGKH